MNMLFLNTINVWLKEKNDSLSLFKLPNELGSVQNICVTSNRSKLLF